MATTTRISSAGYIYAREKKHCPLDGYERLFSFHVFFPMWW